MYIITKDIFGTWKKGKVITPQFLKDKFGKSAAAITEGLINTGVIKPYKANSGTKKK